MLRIKLLAAAIAASSLAAPALADKANNAIRFANDQVLENVDPYFNNVRIGFIVSHQVWDTLIYRDPKTGQYSGQLATGWRWLDDKTLEVELRKGVKFHNGAPFDADDVVYTLNFVAKPENKVITQQNVDWIDRAEKVHQYAVRIVTKRPFPAAIEYLAGPVVIMPHAYYAAVGPKGMNEKPVGSGPFRVVEHAIGKYLRMERNPDYFADGPKRPAAVDKLEIRFMPDRQTQVAELLSGGLDFLMAVQPDQAQQLRAMPRLQVMSGETMRYVFLQLNTMDNTPAPPLKDIRVRQAIIHAIDRQTMVKQIVGEDARVIDTVCFPQQFGCSHEGAPQYGYDPGKAKQLLAAAGFANGFDIDFYAYRERDQTEAMISYLRAVGITANLRFVQFPAMREAMRSGKAGMTHQTWGSFSVNDVSAAVSVWHKGTADDSNRDPEITALLERGDSSVDAAVRKDAYAKALRLIAERAYAVPLYTLPTYYVANKDLVFTPYSDEVPRFWEMRYQ
jgi:peptide/nickel transport system substrate-binding protein